MKHHVVLKDFKGSQQGYTPTVHFKEGEVVKLHPHLAEVAVQYGDAREATAKEISAAEVASEELQVAPIGPTEAKVIVPDYPKNKKIKLGKKA